MLQLKFPTCLTLVQALSQPKFSLSPALSGIVGTEPMAEGTDE